MGLSYNQVVGVSMNEMRIGSMVIQIKTLSLNDLDSIRHLVFVYGIALISNGSDFIRVHYFISRSTDGFLLWQSCQWIYSISSIKLKPNSMLYII